MTQPLSDYSPIAETPGIRLSQEQFGRFVHRYLYGAKLAHARRVLEVACGAGSGASLVQQSARQLVGMDFTESLLRQMQAHYGASIPLLCGDAQRLPCAAASFDLVVCFEAIYYLADYRAFLAECRRVLAPNGRILITLSNPDFPYFVPGRLSTYYPSLTELARSLKDAGFCAIQVHGLLPVDRQTGRHKMVHLLRRVFLSSVMFLLPAALTSALKRAVYGQLQPLPPRLQGAESARHAAELPLTALSTQQIDRLHRVLYVEAQV